MPEPKTITLSLTEKDVELIKMSICAEVYDLKEVIKLGDEYPDSDYYPKYAAEAKVKIPLLEDLHSRISRMEMDEKYPLLGGQET